MSTTVSPQRRDLPTLTGMRMLAAGAVFFTHYRWILPRTQLVSAGGHRLFLDPLLGQGTLGVNFFFVLSGFVLTWSFTAGTDAATFARRRVARVWPSHAVMWAVALALSIPVALFRAGALATVLNLVLLQAWWKGSWNSLNSVSWTLSCEAFFYAVFPLVRPRLTTLPHRAAVAAATVFVAVPFVIGATVHDQYLRMHFPASRVWEFLLGIVAAHVVRSGRTRWLPPVWVGVGLLGTVIAIGWATGDDGLAQVALPIIPFTLIVMRAARNDVEGRTNPLHAPWAQTGGRWSFAFYLVHVIPFTILVDRSGYHSTAWGPALAWGAVALVASVAAAGALHTWVETPLERRIRRGRPRAEVPAAPAG